jgi:hypothetical protein
MYRWWRARPVCRRCKKRHPQNEFRSPLCSRCRARANSALAKIVANGGPIRVMMYKKHETVGAPGNFVVWKKVQGYVQNGVFLQPDGTTHTLPGESLVLAEEE